MDADTETILWFVLGLLSILGLIYMSGYYACEADFYENLKSGMKPSAKANGEIVWRKPDE